MHDVWRIDFQHHGKTDGFRRHQRFVGRTRHPGRIHRDIECPQDSAGFHLVEHLAPFLQHAFDNQLGPFDIRWLAVFQGSGGLQQKGTVALVGHQVMGGLDRIFRRGKHRDTLFLQRSFNTMHLVATHAGSHDRLVAFLLDRDDTLFEIGHHLAFRRCDDQDQKIHAWIGRNQLAGLQKLLTQLESTAVNRIIRRFDAG